MLAQNATERSKLWLLLKKSNWVKVEVFCFSGTQVPQNSMKYSYPRTSNPSES